MGRSEDASSSNVTFPTFKSQTYGDMAQAQAKPEFEKGDYVSWKYGAGKATGYVVEKLTEPAKLGSKKFQASLEEPKYKIKSDKSGKIAIRNPETLEKIRDGEPDLQDETNHDQNGTEEVEEEEDIHVEDVEDEKLRSDGGHEDSGDLDGKEEELNGHEDGEQNGSRKRQKAELEERTVDDVELTTEPAWQLGVEEGEKIDGTVKEHTNGTHEEEKVVGLESKEKEEAPHRMPHEEVTQPGQFTDLNAA